MRLEGLHHVTAITADAPRNVDFYAGALGLRFVKKTVNYDAPDVYHLYYGDEQGAPGSIMTFFEFPQAAPGRHGAGMIHTVAWRVAGPAALDFWAARLEHAGRPVEREDGVVRTTDPEGIGLEIVARDVPDPPLVAASPDIPAEHALQGFDGVRAYALAPDRSRELLDRLGFDADGVLAAEQRRARYAYDAAPAERGLQGAGSVHHVAWASHDEDHEAWGEAARQAGARPTPVIDRTYFRSIYFVEPNGVLFELATLSPGFAVDEDAEHLGESLVLPPQHEHLRSQLERTLTPVRNPREEPAWQGRSSGAS
ncbi:MAG TPA: VOC family protein [Solirubrobacteraceae bacterium]|nr:VOC family protein [Solirubrobacteraceae bacterium]